MDHNRLTQGEEFELELEALNVILDEIDDHALQYFILGTLVSGVDDEPYNELKQLDIMLEGLVIDRELRGNRLPFARFDVIIVVSRFEFHIGVLDFCTVLVELLLASFMVDYR